MANPIYTATLSGVDFNRVFTFELIKQNKSWSDMRLIKIVDDPPVNNIPTPQFYNPEIHDFQPSSYFNGTWSSRWSKQLNTFVLQGAFGTPNGKIPLTPVS